MAQITDKTFLALNSAMLLGRKKIRYRGSVLSAGAGRLNLGKSIWGKAGFKAGPMAAWIDLPPFREGKINN